MSAQSDDPAATDRITVRLTNQQFQEIDQLVEAGIVPNRSEVLREGARRVLAAYTDEDDDRRGDV